MPQKRGQKLPWGKGVNRLLGARARKVAWTMPRKKCGVLFTFSAGRQCELLHNKITTILLYIASMGAGPSPTSRLGSNFFSLSGGKLRRERPNLRHLKSLRHILAVWPGVLVLLLKSGPVKLVGGLFGFGQLYRTTF